MAGTGPRGRSEFRASVEVYGATETASELRMMGARAYNTLPLMEQLKEVLAETSKQRVEEAPWPALAESTVVRKTAQGSNPAILRDEPRMRKGSPTRQRDALYRALTVAGAPGQVKRATRTWAIFGVNAAGNNQLFYARFVQNVKGVRRRILAINAETAVVVIERVGSWVRFGEGAGQAGYLRGSFGFKGSPTRGK